MFWISWSRWAYCGLSTGMVVPLVPQWFVPGTLPRLEAKWATGEVLRRFEAVAAALHMTPRTLQRRLAEDDTTFRALVDACRKSILLACFERNETPDETMRHAGYTNPRSFRRALKRWNLPYPENGTIS